ncbi:MAG: hypothetical protein M3235_02080 [Actinomycetota bacterium]|nr:hypothetical protein [Actinomycetota bacterium]
MIRVRLVAAAYDMLPEFMAGAYADAGPADDAATAQRVGERAHARQVVLSRIVELPAVPEPGSTVLAHPYPEELVIEHIVWRTDPDPGEPHAELQQAEVDLDVLADEASALRIFESAGWHIHR